jgi:hypothetical protein
MDDATNEDIYREYIKMQRDIVSGRLICSKEEAATLAAVQLRLEAWPEENLDLDESKYLDFIQCWTREQIILIATCSSNP